jgi:hypothetical protein
MDYICQIVTEKKMPEKKNKLGLKNCRKELLISDKWFADFSCTVIFFVQIFSKQ